MENHFDEVAYARGTTPLDQIVYLSNAMGKDLRLVQPVFGTGKQQLTWLVLLIKDLKAQNKQLTEENAVLRFQVKGNEPITDAEMEVMVLRRQLNDLWASKALLEHNVDRMGRECKTLRAELYETKWKFEEAA